MNEAQTLLDIEKIMSCVSSRNYHWKNFKSDYALWLDDARAVYDDIFEYTPLIQAYFDLMPERIDWFDQTVFDDHRAFKDFQSRLAQQQQRFIEKYKDRNDADKKRLFDYFNNLVHQHRKLLLVRVDLSYQYRTSPKVKQFDRDVKKLINRVQNKDTIFTGQVGYAYRLEQGGKSKGYHCHLLVIYNGSKHCQDSYLGQSIGELWQKEITRGDGLFYNCNQKEHKRYYDNYEALGIGMIERSDKTSINNAYKAISYLANPDKDQQYMRVSLSIQMRQFQMGQFKGRRV